MDRVLMISLEVGFAAGICGFDLRGARDGLELP